MKTPVKKKKVAASSKKKATPPPKKATSKKAAKSSPETWNLRLYVAGQTPKSITAFTNLKRICESQLNGRYKIEIVDLQKQPQLAQTDQIVALPTLVRKLPEPIRRVIGDLSNLERVMVGMDLNPPESKP